MVPDVEEDEEPEVPGAVVLNPVEGDVVAPGDVVTDPVEGDVVDMPVDGAVMVGDFVGVSAFWARAVPAISASAETAPIIRLRILISPCGGGAIVGRPFLRGVGRRTAQAPAASGSPDGMFHPLAGAAPPFANHNRKSASSLRPRRRSPPAETR